jgi:oligopeptide/dipeptide ABC transporter ATP-binding protein
VRGAEMSTGFHQPPSGDGGDVLLEISDLKTYFALAEGTVRAVDGLDLTIRRGQTLGVVGESGCGKSITSLSILGIVPHPGRVVSGRILYHRSHGATGPSHYDETIDLAKLKSNSRRLRAIRGNEISMVFQEPMTAMSPVLTVGRQITEVIRLHGNVGASEARKIAIGLLAKVGIAKPGQTIDDYPFQLSGGMRQRAVIAMALSCNPKLLIADEPTTALDVTTEAQILDLLGGLQREYGMGMMYITHNLGVVAGIAQDIAVMYLGRVVEQASTRDIFYSPKHPYTQGLLKSIPKLGGRTRGRLETIAGTLPDPYTVLTGCPFHPRCAQAMPGVCDALVPRPIEAGPGHTVRCHLYDPGIASGRA